MGSLVASGRIVDCILVLMAVETVVLLRMRGKTGGRFPPTDLLVNLGAGASLLLALRAALGRFAWEGIALWLLVALSFHVWEVALRWSQHRTR